MRGATFAALADLRSALFNDFLAGTNGVSSEVRKPGKASGKAACAKRIADGEASDAFAAREPRRGGNGAGSGAAVITRTRTQTKKPDLYRVLLLNDDYTPMEFVVAILLKYFHKAQEEATRIMLHVHQNGVGECGVFTYEVAETKVTQVMDYARKHQHPLQCIMEKK